MLRFAPDSIDQSGVGAVVSPTNVEEGVWEMRSVDLIRFVAERIDEITQVEPGPFSSANMPGHGLTEEEEELP